jgi:hypothetical protein
MTNTDWAMLSIEKIRAFSRSYRCRKAAFTLVFFTPRFGMGRRVLFLN